MKRLAITKVSGNYWSYSNGWDTVDVLLHEAESQDLYNGKYIYTVSWPGGVAEKLTLSKAELYELISQRILFPAARKLTEAEAEAIFKQTGIIRGIVKIPFDYARGLTDALMLSMSEQVVLTADFVKESILSSQLIRALIESKHMTIGGVTTGPKYRLKSYDILGFDTETKDIYLMVHITLEH